MKRPNENKNIKKWVMDIKTYNVIKRKTTEIARIIETSEL